MKLQELIKNRQRLRSGEYLHGSEHELSLGLILTARGNALKGVDADIEETLEAARPSHMPKRGDGARFAHPGKCLPVLLHWINQSAWMRPGSTEFGKC
jgi:hypothetical protein